LLRMHEKLQLTLDTLGSAEKSLVEEQYGTDLRRWAQTFDQISSRLDVLATFGEPAQNDFQNLVSDMEAILADISKLNMLENPTALEHVKNRVVSFKNGAYSRLLDFKSRVQSAEIDTTNLDEIKKVLEDARHQANEYRKQIEENSKTFAENLQKQAKGSTRTLARHFNDKVKELATNDLTSPENWEGKRVFWLRVLIGAALLLPVVYVFVLIICPDLQKYAIQIGIAKLALLGLAYLQYNFATRNYHIAADHIAHYEQQEVIAKTLNDFIATASEDTVLKEHLLANATKTLFAEIKTGHLKERAKDGSMIENIINQWPKGGS
jgi:hypothetical protein